MSRCAEHIDVVCIHLLFGEEEKMLNLAIRIFYIAVPACMVLQTLVLGYMALVLNKISKRRRKSNG